MGTDYVQVETTAGVTSSMVYPWPYTPNIPINPYPFGSYTYTWPTYDETRIAALEARLIKLERENRRLKRGLSRLYIERKHQKEAK